MSGDGIKKNRGGRPSDRDEAKRAPINMRTTPTIRAALQAAADEGGRSLSQEIERRLEHSLTLEEELGGSEMLELFRSIGAALRGTGVLQTGWRSDVTSFAMLQAVVTRTLSNSQPIPSGLFGAFAELSEAHDDNAAVAAAQRIRTETLRIREAQTKALEIVNATLDAMSGISSSDRSGAEISSNRIDALSSGSSEVDRGA